MKRSLLLSVAVLTLLLGMLSSAKVLAQTEFVYVVPGSGSASAPNDNTILVQATVVNRTAFPFEVSMGGTDYFGTSPNGTEDLTIFGPDNSANTVPAMGSKTVSWTVSGTSNGGTFTLQSGAHYLIIDLQGPFGSIVWGPNGGSIDSPPLAYTAP